MVLAMVIIDVRRFEALIFDLDGVITQTASIHARAWKQLFDEFLARRVTETDGTFVPFDLENDYRRYVDGKPRLAGVASFLAARGMTVPTGAPGDQADQGTAQGLASRKDHYFAELLTREGVHVSASAEPLLREARRCGMRTGIASSSHHCAEILHAGGLTALFDARVDGIDLDRLGLAGKPAPDMFLEADGVSTHLLRGRPCSRMRRQASKPLAQAISDLSSASDPQRARWSYSSMVRIRL